MLEIFIVYSMCKSIGTKLREKGRSPLLFQIMLVVMWIGGEVAGAIVGIIIEMIRNGPINDDGFNWMVYLFALIGAAIGAAITFAIVSFLPPVAPRHDAFGSQPGGAPNFDYLQNDPNNPYASPPPRD